VITKEIISDFLDTAWFARKKCEKIVFFLYYWHDIADFIEFTYKAKAFRIEDPEGFLGLVDRVCFPHLPRFYFQIKTTLKLSTGQ